MTASAKPGFVPSKETYIAGFTRVAIVLRVVLKYELHFPPLTYNLPLFAALLIMKVMHETEQQRLYLRRLGDQLGAWYTPIALGVAAAAELLSGQPQRFLAVVVIATSCPLLLATPTAIIGAISLAARRAIIIRNPAVLERIEECRTVIFDKTGTLTYGRPNLTEILCALGFNRDEVLRYAPSVEQYSKHPLASAVVLAAKQERSRHFLQRRFERSPENV
jgi:P-type E1-E2 ATPase